MKGESVEQQIERLFRRAPVKIEVNGCWTWVGSTDKDGYGIIAYRRENKINSSIRSHRVAYQIYNGSLPKEGSICHACDNPTCVNPKHLFWGSHADNMKDMAEKFRSAKGERHGVAKLNDDKVRKIRERLSHGLTTLEIAREFGVAPTTISSIKSGKNWSHVMQIPAGGETTSEG